MGLLNQVCKILAHLYFLGLNCLLIFAGKTHFVRALLRDYRSLIYPSRESLTVLWNHGQIQSLHREPIMAPGLSVKYKEGLIDYDSLARNPPDVLILDDLMTTASKSNDVSDMFVKGCHHLNVSVIFIVQNLFAKGNAFRTVSLNTHYFVLMRTARDRTQIATLGRQIFPGKGREFVAAYEDSTAKPYRYLVSDLHPTTPDELRVRTRILTSETPIFLRRFTDIAPIIYKI